MSRVFFGLEKGVDIYAENGSLLARLLSGTAAPDGLGDQSSAPIGSLYLRSGTGELYQKIANAGNSADYQLNGSSNASVGKWRPERIKAVTNDTVAVGSRNLSTTPFADDNGTLLTAADFVVGDFVIADADGTPLLREVTAISSPSVTFAAAASPLVAEDTFVAINYLPDADGGENRAIVNYNGSVIVKLGDIDWSIATGINLSGSYAAASGNVAASDTVEAAIAKLDGVNDNQDSLLGTAQGAVNLGTFTGATIPDSSTVKGALQSLETAHEEVDQNVNDLITLSGVAENATDLGTFTGDIISDNDTVKGALQDLETELVDTRGNTDDLITLSGVAENSANLGAFSSPGSFLLTATETIKSALQKLADYLFGIKVTQTVGVTTITAVDSVAHSTYKAVQWHVEVFVTGTPANREYFVIDAITDGTNVDDTKYAKLKLGSAIAGLASSVAINGANLELRIVSTPSVTVNVRRITVI